MKAQSILLISTLLVGCFSGCEQSAAEMPYSVAREAAVQNVATAEGEAYRQAVGQQMLTVLVDAYQQGVCVPAIGTIELLVLVSASGETGDVRARPENETGGCLVEALRDLAYPSPPRADFWVRFETSARPKEG